MDQEARKSKKKWIAVAAVAAIASLIAAGILRKPQNKDTVLGTVKRGDIVEAVYGIGTVTASRVFQLKVGVTSTIQKIYVKEGDFVKKGTRLVDLDGPVGWLAPFAGTITSLSHTVGETVFPQTPIITVTDLSDRYVVVSLDQQAIMRVVSGQKATLSFDSLRDEKFEGTVQSVYSSDTQFLVRIATPNLGVKILPGMTADVAITIKTHKNSMLLPIAGVSNGKVLALREGNKIPIDVKLGVSDGSIAEVVDSNLVEGDQIIAWSK